MYLTCLNYIYSNDPTVRLVFAGIVLRWAWGSEVEFHFLLFLIEENDKLL